MEILGLSDSTPRSESRLKSLFWPTIQSGSDVDYLGAQGYWVCTLVAVLSFVFLLLTGQTLGAIVVLLFYHLGGVGVRERSRFAATVVLLGYATDTLAAGLSVMRVLIGALLLSNLRATWIASHWTPGSDEAALPPRLNETLGDKLSDRWPMWVWPKLRIAYYVFSVAILAVTVVGLLALRHHY